VIVMNIPLANPPTVHPSKPSLVVIVQMCGDDIAHLPFVDRLHINHHRPLSLAKVCVLENVGMLHTAFQPLHDAHARTHLSLFARVCICVPIELELK